MQTHRATVKKSREKTHYKKLSASKAGAIEPTPIYRRTDSKSAFMGPKQTLPSDSVVESKAFKKGRKNA